MLSLKFWTTTMSAPNLFVLDPKLVCIIETSTRSPLPGWQKLAEVGIKIFVRHVFAIFVTSLCAELQICKFNSYDMQYIQWSSALLLKKHCVWPKSPFLGQSLPKSVWIATNLNIAIKKRMLGLQIFVQIQTFRRRPFKPSHNFCHPDLYLWSKLQQGGKEARNSYICTLCLWDSPSLLVVLPSYSQEPARLFSRHQHLPSMWSTKISTFGQNASVREL